MPPKKSLWYRLGYALERARHGRARGPARLRSLAERAAEEAGARLRGPKRGSAPRRRKRDAEPERTTDELLALGLTAVAANVLEVWRPARPVTFGRMVRAAATGAAAAVAVEALRALLEADEAAPDPSDVAERVVLGAGQGVVYGAVFEPRIPGPPLLKGALYGTAEYTLGPLGGLSGLLGPATPLRRVPLLSDLLAGVGEDGRTYLDHLLYAMTLSLLYGSSPARRGIRIEADEV